MIVTKEQQERLVDKYVKEKHTTDECIGFIDGLNAGLELVKNLAIHDVRKSFPLIEGKTKSNVKKYNGVGRQAPPPPARTIKGNVS